MPIILDKRLLICPVCREQRLKSKVKFIGHQSEIAPLWDYDEDGHIIERTIQVKIECDRGHKTDAHLTGQLDKAQQL